MSAINFCNLPVAVAGLDIAVRKVDKIKGYPLRQCPSCGPPRTVVP